MKVAFCGTSGAGKTTLVKYVSGKYGLPHISGSSGDLKTEHDKNILPEINGKGHENVIVYSATHPEEGMLNQEQILYRRTQAIINNNRFVTDRSPIDNMVYMTLQCSYHKDISRERCQNFVDIALKAWEGLTHIIYIVPVQPEGHIENNGSRIVNPFYQVSVDAAFDHWLSFFQDQIFKPCLRIDYWDLKRRKDEIDYFIAG